MVNFFVKLFDKILYERSLTLVLSLTDSNLLIQIGFTNDEIHIIKNIAFQKTERQADLKHYVAMDLLEKQFSN